VTFAILASITSIVIAPIAIVPINLIILPVPIVLTMVFAILRSVHIPVPIVPNEVHRAIAGAIAGAVFAP
jgi:hypothetical protein